MKATETYTSCMHVHVRFHIYSPQVIIRNKAVIQIHHGFGEHADRYDHFASYLMNRGYVVVVSDFVGHGQSLIDFEQGYFGMENGSDSLVKDMLHLYDVIRERYPDIPYFMLGDDLGSLLIRKFVSVHPDLIDGILLLGTIAKIHHAFLQKRYISIMKALNGPLYKTHAFFQKRIHRLNQEDALAWFSSDEKERQIYLDDPMTHFLYTLQGQQDIMKIIEDVNSEKTIMKKRPYLEIYVGVGEEDPLSKNVDSLVEKYKKAGIQDVSYHVFPKRRHALLFEKNKQEIYLDLLNWLNERTFV